MILIPFIENAFKHGKKTDVSPGIHICLKVKDRELDFIIRNYISTSTREITDAGGFGLKNIKRRLDLLYGKDYSLNIQNDGKEFIIELKINLYED